MFNILYEPWMGVIDMTGQEKLVGLRDYLVNAHLYKRSAENKFIPILRRLQQRLAETFVMDIFGLDVETEVDLLNVGHFDSEKIDDYIKECEESGISFDLFDKNRPFMQADEKTFEKLFKSKSSGSVAAINPKMGSGNNKMFFNHPKIEDYLKNTGAKDIRDSYYDSAYTKKYASEDAATITFAEYANLLLIAHNLTGQGGKGYYPGLMCIGVPPILYHLDSTKHQTLFHSILINAAFDDKHNDESDAPLWRWKSYEDGKNYIDSAGDDLDIHIPKMSGMFFPVLCLYPDVSSINIENKTISRVYKTNISFNSDTLSAARKEWLINTEPSISLLKVEEKEFVTGIRFTESNRSWLDIKTYADIYGGGAPKSLPQNNQDENDQFYVYLHRSTEEYFGQIEMTAYYIAMKKAKYLAYGVYQCYLPPCILHNKEKNRTSENFITAAENLAYSLKNDVKTVNKALNSTDPSQDHNTHEIQTVEKIISNRFMRRCEGLFKNEFIPKIAAVDANKDYYTVELEEILQEYIKKMAKFSWELIRQVPVPYGKSIEAEKVYEKIRKERRKRSEQRSKND